MVKNNGMYGNASFEITPSEIAKIFDNLNIGIKSGTSILESIWEHEKWVIPEEYRYKRMKARFIKDVLYQIDYLYQKRSIDPAVEEIHDNAEALGYMINPSSLISDLDGVSLYFKKLWIQLRYLRDDGCIRAKASTVLAQYGYKRRSDKFCSFFDDCLYFYKIDAYSHGKLCSIRDVPGNCMITFKIRSRRRAKRKS